MSNLIRGKEALIALANGQEVEYWCENDPSIQKKWTPNKSLSEYKLSYFLENKPRFEFRLKPRTITINGIEVPAPFDPKDCEPYWFITDSECGYNWVENKEGCRVGIAAWRTEDEIKQVVTVLRQALGGSHDN